MLVLDKKIREKNRGEKGIKWASKGNRDGWVVHIHREKKQNLRDNTYSAYSEICYYGTHTALKNKSQTYTVEGVNSDLRHYIPALHCRSKCFFGSLDTMKAVF